MSTDYKQEIEEILFHAFVGLWMRDSDGAFIQIEGRYDILKDGLRTALTHLIETEKKKAIDDYILVTLGWMTANQENLAVHEIITTLERQSEELQRGIDNEV